MRPRKGEEAMSLKQLLTTLAVISLMGLSVACSRTPTNATTPEAVTTETETTAPEATEGETAPTEGEQAPEEGGQ